MKVRYLVEIDKDPNHVLDMQADCQDIEDALAVRFHRLKGQVKAEPYMNSEDLQKLRAFILREFAKEGIDYLSVFKLYENAVAHLGNMYPLHKVGVQALCAGAVRNAADFWRRCDEIVKKNSPDGDVTDTAPQQP